MKLTTVGFWGAFPRANEATSCYLVQDEDTRIVLDCGSGALSRLQNYVQLNELDAVFISHTHADHIADIYCLEYAMLVQRQLGNRKTPLDVYIYTDELRTLPFTFPEALNIQQLHVTDRIQVGSLSVTFSENVHDIPCCSMKVTNRTGQTLVYSGDTGYTDTLIQFAKGVDVLLIECSLYMKQQGLIKGHLASNEVGKIAQQANVKHVVLTHFPHYGHLNRLREEVRLFYKKKITYAKEGLTITL
ncbi:MAG TPA: MBL fold metallo-hydrolase [Cerasibacillus sp.]|uniref:MBL fold metallo-hydrolase n=1 Tax=Cerasibacillus sp. TaxID=2498711 RepID=UPI002F4164ED